MRALLTACFVGLSFFCCAAGAERFSLSAKLVQPKQPDAALRLAIELRNVSGQPQRVVTLTNLFEGRVYLRDVAGDVHEFIQSNYWIMMCTGEWVTPTIELAPGGSYHWEHALPQFIDWRRQRTEPVGNSYRTISYRTIVPILSTEFQQGCEIWCVFDVRQKKMLDEIRSIEETTATVMSAKVPYPK